MKNCKMTTEFQEMNKNINISKNDMKEQNKKINEINEKLDVTEKKTKIAKSYLSGFSSIFGFFPKLFKSSKSKTENKEKENENQNNPKEKKHHSKNEKNDKLYYDEFEELEREIYDINKNAQDIKNEIIKSKQGTDHLNKKIEITNVKMEKIKKEAEKIKNNY